MTSKKKLYVPGDLVLVKFPGWGYWPCQVTEVLKHSARKVKCFGEDTAGTAFPKNMVYYTQANREKYISKSSLKTYPYLAEALTQIESGATDSQSKTTESKNSKRKISKEMLKESAAADSESGPVTITYVGDKDCVGFIKDMALGETGIMDSVKIESGSSVEEVEERKIDNDTDNMDIDVDEIGAEFDYKIKVELESDVGDFDESRETDAMDDGSQIKTSTSVQPCPSETTSENIDNTTSPCPSETTSENIDNTASPCPSETTSEKIDNTASPCPSETTSENIDNTTSPCPSEKTSENIDNTASYEDETESQAVEKLSIGATHSKVSQVSEAEKEPATPTILSQPDMNVPSSSSWSTEEGDQEKRGGLTKVTLTYEMPASVFTKFAPLFMEAASQSNTSTLVISNQQEDDA